MARFVVAWNPNSESDLAGYRIYYGTSPTVYTTTIEVPYTQTEFDGKMRVGLEGFSEFTTYYFAVTAYDTNNNESSTSTEVSAKPSLRHTFALVYS